MRYPLSGILLMNFPTRRECCKKVSHVKTVLNNCTSNGKIDKRLLCQLAAEQDVHNCGFDVTHIRKTIATVKQAEIVPSSSASRPGSRASTPVDLPAAPLQDDFSSVGSDCSSADSSFPPTPPSIASPAPMNKDVLMWDPESGRSLMQLDSQQPLVRIV